LKTVLGCAALMLCWITGCGPSVIVRSRVSSEGHPRLGRVYIVLNGGEKTESMVRSMGLSFPEVFNPHGVTSKVYVMDPLSLDPNEYRMDAWKFKPDAVLVVRFTEATMREDRVIGAVFDVTLHDGNVGKIYWRASAKMQFDGLSQRGYGEEFAKEIVAKMAMDGLFP